MDEIEFIKKYESEKPMYNSWGNYVAKQILSHLKEKVDVNIFLKIPPIPRLKDNASILQKAFYRNKAYTNPYNDITDKVGVRFVVLLLSDIKVIKKIIEHNEVWSFSKDRDFEEERKAKPSVFEYESVHYILRNKNIIITDNNIVIKKGTPCEVQIRALLQHAYSELTHDKTYKPKTIVKPEVYRLIARSMALIETTDNIFEEVNNMLKKSNKADNNLLPYLTDLYKKINIPQTEEKLTNSIFDSYKEDISKVKIEEIQQFLNKYKFIKDIINDRYNKKLLYRQPIVLLIYYMAKTKHNNTWNKWPFTHEQIKQIYIDLGIGYQDL